jgi:hypothetical protein
MQHLNKINENTSKQLNELKEDTNKQLNKIKKAMQEPK